MQALLEIDYNLLCLLSLLLLCELFHCLLSLFNVFRFAQISNNSFSFVNIDSCFLLNAFLSFLVLFKIFLKRKWLFNLDVLSHCLINSLNSILDVLMISNYNIRVLEGTDLIWNFNLLILN